MFIYTRLITFLKILLWTEQLFLFSDKLVAKKSYFVDF